MLAPFEVNKLNIKLIYNLATILHTIIILLLSDKLICS